MNQDSESDRRAHRIGIWQLIAVVIFIVTLTAVSCSLERTESSQKEPTSSAPPKSLAVKTVAVPAVTQRLVIIRTGTLRANKIIDIIPQVSGRVEFVAQHLERGGSFTANEVLFRIEQIDYRAAVAEQKSQVRRARRRLAQAQAEAHSARAEWRMTNPNTPAPPLVAYEPQLQEAKANLRAARAALSAAERDMSRTRYSLSFAGRVLSSRIDIGQFLQPSGSYGQVYAHDSLEAVIPVERRFLSWFTNEPQRVDVHFPDTIQEQPVRGRIARTSAELDARTRFGAVYVNPANSDEWAHLTPNSFIEAYLYGPKRDGVWNLPNSVLQENQGVWIVRDSTLEWYEPQIISIGPDQTLAIGDGKDATLVSGMLQGASEGMKVQIVADSAA